MEKWTVLSADGHFGGPPKVYVPYFDAAYRGCLDHLVEEDRITRASFGARPACLSDLVLNVVRFPTDEAVREYAA